MPLGNVLNYKFFLILLIVPLQYFLTYFNTSESVKALRLQEVKSILSNAKKYLVFGSWRNLMHRVVDRILNRFSKYPEETIDNELFKSQEQHKYFATSTIPRSPRGGHVLYRVGQVVRHSQHGFRGVIIGWDEKTRAPELWINYVYSQDKRELLENPSYMVLVDYRDTSNALRMYINQVHLEVITGVKIVNNDIIDYFEHYNGVKYIPRPRLQKLYPED